MKFILIATLSLFSLNSFSNEKDYHKDMNKMIDNMSLEEAKATKLEMLDKKSAMIEQEKKCINAASDKPALKACMEVMWENKKEMKEEMKEKSKKKK